MSEPIPESIPTSTSRLSSRATKKLRPTHPNSTATSKQSHAVATLMANADIPISLPNNPSTNTKSSLPPPPEIVANVQGSSAGAGSGEFHVYKASRRREYERLRMMDEEVKEEKDREEWEGKQAEVKEKERKREGKNRARREKAKERRKKGGGDGKADDQGKNGDAMDVETGVDKGVKPRRRIGANPGPRFPVRSGENSEGDDAAVANGAPLAVNPDEIGVTIHDDSD